MRRDTYMHAKKVLLFSSDETINRQNGCKEVLSIFNMPSYQISICFVSHIYPSCLKINSSNFYAINIFFITNSTLCQMSSSKKPSKPKCVKFFDTSPKQDAPNSLSAPNDKCYTPLLNRRASISRCAVNRICRFLSTACLIFP